MQDRTRHLTNKQARSSLIILSGPSGVGKSTIERRLCGEFGYGRMISHTSRDMRAGEINGVDYYYVSHEEFMAMDQRGDLAEAAIIYGGKGYGLSHAEAWKATDGGSKVGLVVVNTDGARQLRDLWPDAWSIWLDHPSNDTLAQRMRDRGDDPERIAGRIKSADKERADAFITGYTFRVVNDDLDTCLAEIQNIIQVMQKRI